MSSGTLLVGWKEIMGAFGVLVKDVKFGAEVECLNKEHSLGDEGISRQFAVDLLVKGACHGKQNFGCG
jgi:hypothetical protein